MNRSAFTLAETLTAIVLAVLVLIYSYSMIGCGDSGAKTAADAKKTEEQLKETEAALVSARRVARQMQNTTHVVGIHKGLVLYAQGNRDWYPGLDPNGKVATTKIDVLPDQAYGFGTPDGKLVAYRYAVLLRGNYFSPEYVISPAETNPAIKAPTTKENMVDGASYSFAMLNISNPDLPRIGEWRATNNSRAAVITDRNIGGGATGADAQSNHTQKGEGWKGSAVFNDNHGNFEKSDVLRTEYNLKGEIAADKLFSDMEKAQNGTAGADAAMVFKAGDSYVNQNP